MIQTVRKAWGVPELRKKILFTLLILVIYRLGSAIAVPYVDTDMLGAYLNGMGTTILGLYDVMAGGAFSQATVFALGIQPYINSSIIIQLLTVAIPALERMSREGGEEGKKKIQSYTRYATVAIAAVMALSYYILLDSSNVLTRADLWSKIVIIATFVAGSAFMMWLGEQMTEKGIGNGTSNILFVGIVSRAPQAIMSMYAGLVNGTMAWWAVLIIVAVLVAMVAFVCFISEAERRIPVQYAKRVVGRKQYGGQSTHLPMKVNMSGVMPIIFASTIVTVPATIAAFLTPAEGSFWAGFVNAFSNGAPLYVSVYMLLIFAFAYFYSTIQFNPVEVANNMKQNGGFIPGFRPGRPTSDFIARVLNKITMMGAIFLAIVAVIPQIMSNLNGLGSLAVGGTSILIMVSVALETVRAMENMLLMRHYKGFLE